MPLLLFGAFLAFSAISYALMHSKRKEGRRILREKGPGKGEGRGRPS